MSRRWSPAAKRAARQAVERHGLRVICLVCGRVQRFFLGRERSYRGGPRRLRDTACEEPRCGEIALRSVYWVQTHPELAAEAKRRALALARVRTS